MENSVKQKESILTQHWCWCVLHDKTLRQTWARLTASHSSERTADKRTSTCQPSVTALWQQVCASLSPRPVDRWVGSRDTDIRGVRENLQEPGMPTFRKVRIYGTLAPSFAEFWNLHINCQNFMIFPLFILEVTWARWLKRQGAEIRTGRPGFDPGCRRGGDFSSLLRVQTGPGVHSASYKNEYRGLPGGKGGRAQD